MKKTTWLAAVSIFAVSVGFSAARVARAEEAAHPAGCPGGCGAPAAAVDDKVWDVPTAGSPSLGPSNAPITLVEFTDYQCPFCRRAEGVVQTLLQKYPGQIRWVVKQAPLPFHPEANPAARAALAAGAQGRFFEMHQKLFSQEGKLGTEVYDQLARELGLDLNAFHAAQTGDAVTQHVSEDGALGKHLAVSGVPSFFLNGHRITGAQPLEVFTQQVERALGR